MPNIGRPSQGCTRCRQRRIKCDQRKPGCFRCEKLGNECPGYINPDKWLFVDQNAQNGQNGQAGTPAQLVNSDRHPKTGRSPSNTKQQISAALPSDIEFSARCLFFEDFVAEGDAASSSLGNMQYLPKLFLTAADDSCLKHAVTAVAVANMANHHAGQAREMEALMIQVYNKALRSTNEQLAGERAHLDETLATVHLMALYEILTPKFMFTNWRAHVQGTLQLLRIRGNKQLETTTGRQLFNLILTPIILKFLATAQLPSLDSIQMIRDMQMQAIDEDQEPLSAIVASFFFETAVFSAQTRQMFSQPANLDGLRLVSWMSHGEALEASTNKLIETKVAPSAVWHPLTTTADDGSVTYRFSSRSVMAQWVRYWAAQLCLYNTLLSTTAAFSRCSANSSPSSKNQPILQPAIAISHTHRAAENIIRCIPFALHGSNQQGVRASTGSPQRNRVEIRGALSINYALEIMCKFGSVSVEHKTAASQALLLIGRDCGVGRNGRLTVRNDEP